MKNDKNNLSEWLLDFGANIISLVIKIDKTVAGRNIANQLMYAGTSAGANYEEACGAESKADFIHKIQIVLKELRESLYWLKLIKKAELISQNDLDPLLNEADELAKIFAKSIITARGRGK